MNKKKNQHKLNKIYKKIYKKNILTYSIRKIVIFNKILK